MFVNAILAGIKCTFQMIQVCILAKLDKYWQIQVFCIIIFKSA